MTAQAAIARTNAVHFEAKKDGCTQRQSGDWVIRLTVQSLDLDQAVMRAAPGTRYMVALVEIGDDEQPVQQQKEPAASSKTPVPTAKPRQTTLPGHPSYAQSLAIMCSKPQAWMFLFEKMGRSREINDPEQAAEAVRQLCGVQSRNETIIGTPKGDNANRLLSEFEGWKRGLA
jgi:hypothetical protein